MRVLLREREQGGGGEELEGAQNESVGRNDNREMIMMIEQNSNYAYKVIFVKEKGVKGKKNAI